ncbi:serine O-acetyltransferase [Avibacterium paragallinarum]|uniref:serine O-acetyltransferase n=1 Tax=Avibacterium paragallinarum TaxID=728 RepID=UPI00034D2954|nr:serine O-acetyltransferase [Avibacterium paragallinarum]
MPAEVWTLLRQEAKELAECEPMLASFFHSTILKHQNLGNALSYILANKLANPIMPAITLREVIEEAYQAEPDIIASAACDIRAVRHRDPAVELWTTPLLYLKGFHALQSYRITHYLWQQNRKALAIYLQNEISVAFDVDIHPAAKIGCGIMFDHPRRKNRLYVDIHPAAKIGCGIMFDHATGIVVGETSVIENDVSILQGVTLGGTGKESGDRHPKVREGVMIGAGAKILGNIEIGRYAKIGANSVVLQAVPEFTTVAGVPSKTIGKDKAAKPAFEMDQYFIDDNINI